MPMLTGMSRRRLPRVMATGAMMAERPRMSAVLKMLEPMMLPTAISEFRSAEEMKLTTISGADVPMATMVRPMMNSLMPHLRARPEAPSTMASAPMSTSTRPATNRRISIAIVLQFSFCAAKLQKRFQFQANVSLSCAATETTDIQLLTKYRPLLQEGGDIA